MFPKLALRKPKVEIKFQEMIFLITVYNYSEKIKKLKDEIKIIYKIILTS